MKRIFGTLGIMVTGLVMAAVAPPLSAAVHTMRVEVPFTFFVGEQKLPSGNYLVRLDSDFHTLEVRSFRTGQWSRVRVQETSVSRKRGDSWRGGLSFRQYGESLVLKGVYAPGDIERQDVKPSRVEMELSKSRGGAAAERTLSLQ